MSRTRWRYGAASALMGVAAAAAACGRRGAPCAVGVDHRQSGGREHGHRGAGAHPARVVRSNTAGSGARPSCRRTARASWPRPIQADLHRRRRRQGGRLAVRVFAAFETENDSKWSPLTAVVTDPVPVPTPTPTPTPDAHADAVPHARADAGPRAGPGPRAGEAGRRLLAGRRVAGAGAARPLARGARDPALPAPVPRRAREGDADRRRRRHHAPAGQGPVQRDGRGALQGTRLPPRRALLRQHAHRRARTTSCARARGSRSASCGRPGSASTCGWSSGTAARRSAVTPACSRAARGRSRARPPEPAPPAPCRRAGRGLPRGARADGRGGGRRRAADRREAALPRRRPPWCTSGRGRPPASRSRRCPPCRRRSSGRARGRRARSRPPPS